MKKITFNISWPLSGMEVRELLSFVFQVALVSFLGFYIVESLRPGFVASFFNINIFLWAAAVTGILSTVWPMAVPEAKVEEKPTQKDYVWMVLLALCTVVIVWSKVNSIGWLAKVIAPLSGLIVFGLCLLVYFDKDE